jgi:DNA-binding transcriptional LysR family regulator
MDRLPSLNGLRAFEAAARLGGFTAAAQELHVTQAAVSRSVKALEGQLGYPLFQRNANALALTPEGRMLVPDLTSAFELMAKATQRVSQSRAGPVLTVGVGPTFAIRWLIPRLGRFQQRHPEIEVHTATGGATALLRPEWTCSLRLGKDPSPGVVSEPLFSPEMTPVCSPAMAKKLKVPADLAKETLLDIAHTPEDWVLWLTRAGVDPARISRRSVFPYHAFALQAALDGMGVAMGLQPYVTDDLKAGRLVAPFQLSVTKPLGWYLSYRKEVGGSEAFRKFRRWVKQQG